MSGDISPKKRINGKNAVTKFPTFVFLNYQNKIIKSTCKYCKWLNDGNSVNIYKYGYDIAELYIYPFVIGNILVKYSLLVIINNHTLPNEMHKYYQIILRATISYMIYINISDFRICFHFKNRKIINLPSSTIIDINGYDYEHLHVIVYVHPQCYADFDNVFDCEEQDFTQDCRKSCLSVKYLKNHWNNIPYSYIDDPLIIKKHMSELVKNNDFFDWLGNIEKFFIKPDNKISHNCDDNYIMFDYANHKCKKIFLG